LTRPVDGFHIALLLPIAWGGQAALGYYYGLYRGRWINGSFDEVSALGRTAFATTAVLLAIDLLVPGTRPAPASAVIGAGLLAFLAMGGARYAARQMLENQRRQKPDARRSERSSSGPVRWRSTIRDALRRAQPIRPGGPARRRPTSGTHGRGRKVPATARPPRGGRAGQAP
jgi:hypothetical protein